MYVVKSVCRPIKSQTYARTLKSMSVGLNVEVYRVKYDIFSIQIEFWRLTTFRHLEGLQKQV